MSHHRHRRAHARSSLVGLGLLTASLAGAGCGGGGAPPVEPRWPHRSAPPVPPRPVPPPDGLQVAAGIDDCPLGAAPCKAAERIAVGPATVPCSNGSFSDCNVRGTTLVAGSAWVDPAPPSGWRQCAGFVDTPGDDVDASFLDHCLGAAGLRVRVYTPEGWLEEDITVTGIAPFKTWPAWGYLQGETQAQVKTHWGDTAFFTAEKGGDACMKPSARSGTTFGSGNAERAVIAAGNEGADEYRINCAGRSLPGRWIALYRRNDRGAVAAEPRGGWKER